jgi:hypothetical protein
MDMQESFMSLTGGSFIIIGDYPHSHRKLPWELFFFEKYDFLLKIKVSA